MSLSVLPCQNKDYLWDLNVNPVIGPIIKGLVIFLFLKLLWIECLRSIKLASTFGSDLLFLLRVKPAPMHVLYVLEI